jgi:DNA adenine methylase
VIELNDLRGCTYYEPYAGGAGAALNLLRDGVVSALHLNDADARVFAFWSSALNDTERFVERIRTVKLSIVEWQRQHEICASPRGHARADVGFAAFFMNRCNRSGVLTGAGPIGGYEQSGPWQMDVRFNRDGLAERILGLARMKDRIRLSQKDAIAFLKHDLPRGVARQQVFAYLDPPYVNNGQRLYLNYYQEADHADLARYLSAQRRLPWVMSYDDSDLVRELYSGHQMARIPIRYTLQNKRSARELIIAPHHVGMPGSCRVQGVESLLHFNQASGRPL